MDLFVIEGYVVMPRPETLMISVFKEIWEADNEPKKPNAMAKFAYIEFMCSYKKNNPFVGYSDKEERATKILDALSSSRNGGSIEDPRENVMVMNAMEFYLRTQYEAAPSLRFYEAALSAAEELISFFTDLDMNDTNSRTGNPLYKPAEITRALKDTNDIIKTLGALKDKVQQEIFEDSKGKGGRQINYFEQ